MSCKQRRKYHGAHVVQRRTRNWARSYREGWLEEDERRLRRQRTALEAIR
jgi:hypothetical protein